MRRATFPVGQHQAGRGFSEIDFAVKTGADRVVVRSCLTGIPRSLTFD